MVALQEKGNCEAPDSDSSDIEALVTVEAIFET
jgi:hypothetical protein